MATKNTISVKMILEKETKGAVRFQEADVDQFTEPKIGTLYVRKSAFKEAGKIPEAILVQVSF